MKGKHHTEAAKQKLRMAFKGKRPVTSPEIIAKISRALKGRPNLLVHGNKSPLWKHGLSATKEYILSVACLRCNSVKRAMTYEEFIQQGQGVPLV